MSEGHTSQDDDDVKRPKRGRPSGKNRVPLSLEERRARNAHYERERRNETADALAQLAKALGHDHSISNAELLATAVTHIQRRTSFDEYHSLEDLQRINTNLESQIETLSNRLGLNAASLELPDEDTGQDVEQSMDHYEEQDKKYCSHETTTKQKNKRKQLSQTNKQRKRSIVEKAPDTDSGIDSQSPTHSESQDNAPCEQTTIQIPFEEYVQAESQAQIDLQSELYRQLYQSGSQETDSVEANPTPYCIQKIAQSLNTIPEIRPPQREIEERLESTSSESPANVEFSPEYVNLPIAYLPDVESTLTMMSEKKF